MSGTVVVIPTYNERENLAGIVGRVRAAVPDADVLVVDDNSPDGTGVIADELALADPRVQVMHRAGKEGLGAAYLAAFNRVLKAGYDRIAQMDADGSHRPEHLPELLAGLSDSEMVIGSRWVRGGQVLNWPKRREWLSRGGSRYARMWLGLEQRDVTGGFRAFRSDALRRIRLEEVESAGYCFQIDVLWHAHQAGLSIVEVPISFEDRRYGESKMSGRIVVEAMLRVTTWGLVPSQARTAIAADGVRSGGRSSVSR
ncbi:polyprenol monophosphomannose synthase [Luethyella okanaganae]|uniref:Polyprenol monophosphomannose synthase n=1 Tax=Luethyella okanaganae TaxID=69372 RepID=A0ABW1VHA4_9MICO